MLRRALRRHGIRSCNGTKPLVHAQDGRGRYARLTPTGRTKLQAAHAVHLRGVRALFLDKLSDDQLYGLVKTWQAVLSEAGANS